MRKDTRRGKIFGTGLLAAAIAATVAVAGVVFVGVKGTSPFAQVTVPAETCTDTDGGINLFVHGVAKIGIDGMEGKDSCQGADLVEYDCGTRGGVPESTHPDFGRSLQQCPENTGCRDGACLSSLPQQSCKDSDEGKNPDIKGTVFAYIRSSTTGQLERVEAVDRCVGTNPEVIENYCIPDGLGGQNYSSITMKCPNGCRDGACLPENQQSCTDSDGGINLSTRGEARQGQKQFRDYCQDENHIFEFDCGTSGGDPESTHPGLGGSQFRCPENTVCRDGACIPSSDTSENCKPLICSDGSVFPQCSPEGYPINYFQDPCRSLDMYAPQPPPTAGFEDEVRVVPVGPVTFSDVRVGSEVASAAQSLAARGVIGGYPDGTFREDRPVNRAELAKFLLLAKGALVPEHANEGRFRDVLEGEWYVKFVMEAAMQGIIDGYPDGTFRPANTVNVAEFLKMTTKALGLPENYPYAYADVSPQDWFSPYAGLAERFELFGRSNTLNPANLLTRGEVAVALEKALTVLK